MHSINYYGCHLVKPLPLLSQISIQQKRVTRMWDNHKKTFVYKQFQKQQQFRDTAVEPNLIRLIPPSVQKVAPIVTSIRPAYVLCEMATINSPNGKQKMNALCQQYGGRFFIHHIVGKIRFKMHVIAV